MAPLTWRFEARIDAPPRAVYEWMIDFKEDDHASEAFRRGAGVKPGKNVRTGRNVLSRDGDTVVLESTWGRSTFKNTVRLDAKATTVRIEGDYGYAATWRAAPDGEATRLEVEGRVAPTGVFRFLMPLFARRMLAQTRADFNGHVEEMREALAADARGKPRP